MILRKTFFLLLFIDVINIFAVSPVDIYLSTKGSSKNNGTINKPLSSLQDAVNLLSIQYKKAPFDKATIWLMPGIYPQKSPLLIDKSIFSNQNVDLTIASYSKNKARISAGNIIPNNLFKKVKDSAILNKLDKKAATHILVANLKGTGLNKLFAQNTDNGTGWDYRKDFYSLLSWDNYLLQLAQWPNRGYAHIEKVISKGPTTRWLKPGEKPADYGHKNPTGGAFTLIEKKDLGKWANEFDESEDMMIQGYPDNDWYFQQEKLGKIEGDSVKLLRYMRYGLGSARIPRRVRFVNLLCELDEPGEWYFDNQSKKLYIYPISNITDKTVISVLSGNTFIKSNSLNHFSLKNLIFENGGDLAVEIDNSSDCLIAGCTFRNMAGRAFNINGGNNNGVLSCDFYGLQSVGSINADFNGDKASGTGLHIDAVGKSRQTLVPCNSYMTNNDIHDCRLRGYGVIGLNGVGIKFSHNLLHDMNGAVNFSGNDIILEYNEFYNMGWEMGDWNVAYIGADWASFGNEVRYNFVHHMMEIPQGYALAAFRNDDLGMGTKFNGNYFYKTGKGGVVFSGAGNECCNNIALETVTVYHPAARTKKYLEDSDVKDLWNKIKVYDNGEYVRGDKDDFLWRAERFYGKMGWNFEPYKSKYPLIKKIMDDGDPFAPSFCTIKENYVGDDRCMKDFENYSKIYPKTAVVQSPKIISSDAFENLSVLNLSFKKSFKPMEGFKVSDFSKIGMYSDEYRVAPNKDKYRKEIKDKYEGIPCAGGRYDIRTANDRYPIPEYLLKTKMHK